MPRSTPVVLPVAATEQHGPHLPMATDRLIVEHLVTRLDARVSSDGLILPTIAIGCSEHHMSFAGSLSLAHATMLATIEDVLTSVARHGFRNFVVLNGHGGNAAIVQVALERVGSRDPACRVVATSWWRLASDELQSLSDTGPGGVGHACEFETSLLLHICPDMVRAEAIPHRPNVATFAWAESDMIRSSPATLYRDMWEMTGAGGVFGEPAAATAEKGGAIVDLVVDALERIVRSLAQNA